MILYPMQFLNKSDPSYWMLFLKSRVFQTNNPGIVMCKSILTTCLIMNKSFKLTSLLSRWSRSMLWCKSKHKATIRWWSPHPGSNVSLSNLSLKSTTPSRTSLTNTITGSSYMLIWKTLKKARSAKCNSWAILSWNASLRTLTQRRLPLLDWLTGLLITPHVLQYKRMWVTSNFKRKIWPNTKLKLKISCQATSIP